MKDYYDLFVALSLQQCTKNDYTDKNKLKKHNAASKKLKKLQLAMKENVSEDILRALLDHEDDRVKINAASFCLESKILSNQATLTLKNIVNISNDETICFSAKMLLQKIVV